MLEIGVVDPTLVKMHALKAASEVAEAILRIDTIIRRRKLERLPRQIENTEEITGGEEIGSKGKPRNP